MIWWYVAPRFLGGSKVCYHEKQVNPIFHRRCVYLCGGSIDALVDTVVGCICNLPWHRIPFETRKQRDRDVSPGVRLPESLGKNWVTLQPQYLHAFRTTLLLMFVWRWCWCCSINQTVSMYQASVMQLIPLYQRVVNLYAWALICREILSWVK